MTPRGPEGIPTPRDLAAILNVASPRPATPHWVPVIAEPVPMPAPPVVRPLRDRLADGESVPLLLFTVGGERFAVGLAEVHEAIDAPVRHALPEVGNGTMGVMAVRGSLVSVYDPGPVLGCRPSTAGTPLIVRRGKTRLALAVDDVLDVVVHAPGDLRAAPGTDGADGVLLGAIATPGGLAAVLDLSSLLAACAPSVTESE
jgi:chemotaxis signal transduction protein